MANKMIDLSNIARLAAALDSRMKNKIEEEELRAKEEESNLLQAIKEVEEMLGGKSLIYLTQAEYDELTEEEKNNESIMYIITDAEDISHEHDNLEFLNSLNETDYMQLGTDIEALKNNKVDEAEYNSKISELTTSINNEIDRATEKESEILADTTSKITEVENMLGGKSFVYLTQAEYDELTEEDKSNDEIIYFITDAQDASHTHDNKEFLDSLSEDNFEEISAEIGALETSMSNEVSRVEAMLGGKSFVYLTQAEYDELTEEDKNDEAKIYVVTDTVSMSHVHDNKEFLDSLNEEIFNDIDSAIQSLENNKLDVSIYNEVVPGLSENSHTHENQDFLDELNEEEFAQMNADIVALKTSVSGKADTEHNHDDMYYTETEIDGKIEDINEDINGKVAEISAALEYLDGAKANASDALAIFIQSVLSQEGESYDSHTLVKGEKIISPIVSVNTVIDDNGSPLTDYLSYFDTSIASLSSSIGNGNELLTETKDSVVSCINELQTEINGLQGDVNEFESALETVDAIKLNGYSIWVGTTEELNNVAQRDPNTLYFEISDEEDSEEVVQVVQVVPVDGVLTLTTNKYQKTTIEDGTEIVFPEVNKFTEIHLYFDAESAMNLTFPDCRWRVEPNIEAGKSYEIVATYNTIQWLVNVIVYS